MTISPDIMRTMRLYFFFVLLVSINQVHGQTIQSEILKRYNAYTSKNLAEYAYLAIDNGVFYSGSQIAFNAVLFDQFLKPSTISKIVHLELIHENNEYRRKYKYEIENGLISAIIKLPLDIPTGNYQLVAYTNAMRNFDLNRLMDRRLLYIQNTLEPTQSIAMDHNISIKYEQQVTLPEKKISLNVEEEVDRILFEIEIPNNKVDQEFYLVGEGLQGIEFIQKFDPHVTSLPKQKLGGSFQRMTVISNSKEVMASKSFLVNHEVGALEPSYTLNQDSIKLFVPDNLITSVALNKPITNHATLFERICEIYFGSRVKNSFDNSSNSKTLIELPSNGLQLWENILSIDEQDVNEYIPEISLQLRTEIEGDLTSLDNAILSIRFIDKNVEFSKSIGPDGKVIMDINYPLPDGYAYIPEVNSQLRAQIEGDLTLLDEAILSIHFFEENVEFSIPIGPNGKVIMDINYPLPDDYAYAFIINGDGKDLSSEFEIVFDSGPYLSYIPNSAYLEKDYSDSLLYSKYEHYYVLSTFADLEEPNDAFWTNLPIDATFNVEDYRDIADFEEFIKEAVHNVSVRNENSKKSLRILNPFKGYPTEPKLVILNDRVIEDHSILFDLPLANIKSIHVIDSKENLLTIGTKFSGGVLIVTTADAITIPSDALDANFTSINGIEENKNNKHDMLNRFGTTKLFKLSDQVFFSEILERNETPGLQLFVETLQKDGTFSSFRTSIPE